METHKGRKRVIISKCMQMVDQNYFMKVLLPLLC